MMPNIGTYYHITIPGNNNNNNHYSTIICYHYINITDSAGLLQYCWANH